MDILTLSGISKIYGDLKALDNINLTVEEGEWLSIMGPSGSGKTTLMNIIGCMDKPSLGKIELAGQDISKLSSKELTIVRRDTIGLVFQQFHLVNYLTALENVMMASCKTGIRFSFFKAFNVHFRPIEQCSRNKFGRPRVLYFNVYGRAVF